MSRIKCDKKCCGVCGGRMVKVKFKKDESGKGKGYWGFGGWRCLRCEGFVR